MFTVPEQFSNATKAGFDAHIALLSALTQKALVHVEKIVELNMNVAKASFAESTAAAQELLASKGPQEFITLSTAKAKPQTEKVLAYGRELASIAVAAQSELSNEAQFQVAESRRKIAALVEDVSKNAPAGSEGMVAMVKTAMGNANAGFDQLSKHAKSAADAIEVNVTNTVEKFSQAAVKPAARATKK